MAVTDINFPVPSIDNLGIAVRPVSLVGDWATLDTAPATLDAAPPINPALVTRATKFLAKNHGGGTLLSLRLKYKVGITVTADVVGILFGKTTGGKWERLPDINGNFSITLTIDLTNDVRDTTHQWTDAILFDLRGCVEVMFVNSVALDLSDNDDAQIEGKMI